MKGTGQVPGAGQLGTAKTQTGQVPKLWGGRIELVSLQLLKNCHVEPIVIPCMVLPLHHHLPNPVVILRDQAEEHCCTGCKYIVGLDELPWSDLNS